MVIGSSGESVDSSALQPRVDLFRQKIDALTSAASSARDATEKKGHVNCDVLDIPVEAMAGCMTGRGC